MGGSWQRFRLLSCRIKAAVLRARGGEGRPAGREVDRADHIEPCLFGSRREQKPIALPANREAEPVLPRPTHPPALWCSDLLHLRCSLWIGSMLLKVRELRQPWGSSPS